MHSSATTILLIRHGHTDAIGRRLVGRTAGVHLTGLGREQAARLPDRLSALPITRICASPLERAIETAEPLARARRVEIETMQDLIEVEFGPWTGMTFDALAAVPEWARFNTHRATAAVPGGERASEVQARIVSAVERLHAAHAGETIAAVTHADVIRAAVLHYVGASLDMVHAIDITPASVTALLLGDGYPRLLYVNNHDLTA